jgi:hypothetical protein
MKWAKVWFLVLLCCMYIERELVALWTYLFVIRTRGHNLFLILLIKFFSLIKCALMSISLVFLCMIGLSTNRIQDWLSLYKGVCLYRVAFIYVNSFCKWKIPTTTLEITIYSTFMVENDIISCSLLDQWIVGFPILWTIHDFDYLVFKSHPQSMVNEGEINFISIACQVQSKIQGTFQILYKLFGYLRVNLF